MKGRNISYYLQAHAWNLNTSDSDHLTLSKWFGLDKPHLFVNGAAIPLTSFNPADYDDFEEPRARLLLSLITDHQNQENTP